MKAVNKLSQYIFVVLPCCFAGVLLGQLVNSLLYSRVTHWLLYLTVGICLANIAFFSLAGKRFHAYLFRHVSFSWIYFFSIILCGTVLLLLLVPVSLKIREGTNSQLVLQLSSLFALTIVLLQNYLLEQPLVQKIVTDLRAAQKPVPFLNHFLCLLALGAFAFITIRVYRAGAEGFLEIIQTSLLTGTFVFVVMLVAKVLLYRSLKTARSYQGEAVLQNQAQKLSDSRFQALYYRLEKNPAKTILEASPQDRPRLYTLIRQLPLVDQLPELERLQENDLQQDKALAATINFLKRIRTSLFEKGSGYDVDALTDLMEVKGHIRGLIESGEPMPIQKFLHDNRPEVRKAAIFASAHFREVPFIPVLINFLKEPEYAFWVKEALFETGDHCIPYLRSALYRNKENGFFVMQCLELVERFKTNEASEFLLEMLHEPQKKFRYQAAVALLKKEYPLSSLDKTQLLQLVESLIGLIAVLREMRLAVEPLQGPLTEALLEEESEKLSLVIDLLQAFVPQPVHALLKQFLGGRSSVSRYTLHAIVDLFFPLVLRNKCKILLGSDAQTNIAPQLQVEFINEQICFRYRKPADVIGQILKLDYGQIGYWLRVCALKHLGQLSKKQISSKLLAEVFNANELLQETACEVLYDLNYDYYFLYMQRLPLERAKVLKHKIELHKTLAGDFKGPQSHLLYEQILFLKSVSLFSACSYESLARFTALFTLETITEEPQDIRPDPYKSNGYWIVYQGSFTVYHKGEMLLSAGRADVVDLSFLGEAGLNTVVIHPKNLLQVYFIEYSTLNNLYLSSGFLQNAVIQPHINHVVKPILV